MATLAMTVGSVACIRDTEVFERMLEALDSYEFVFER